jgi:hypothetical protein
MTHLNADDAVFDAVAAANFTGLALATLAKMRSRGGGPAYLKLGRKVIYRRGDLADWLTGRLVHNTTEAEMAVPRRLTDATGRPDRQQQRGTKREGG